MTKTIKNRTFISSNGNPAVVWHIRGVEKTNGFAAIGKTIRTYVEVAGRVLDINPGCGYEAERAVKAAGL